MKWPINCHLSEITEIKSTSSIKMSILEENFRWHLEAFASELSFILIEIWHPHLQLPANDAVFLNDWAVNDTANSTQDLISILYKSSLMIISLNGLYALSIEKVSV